MDEPRSRRLLWLLAAALGPCASCLMTADERLARRSQDSGPSIESFSDDFDDGEIDPARWLIDGACSVARGEVLERGGQIEMSFANGPDTPFCFLKTAGLHDLRAGTFTIKVPLACAPSGLGHQTLLRLTVGDDTYEAIEEAGRFVMLTEHGAGDDGTFTAQGSATYDPVADLWWRFRVAGSSTVHFETAAAGGGPWTARGFAAMPTAPTAARIWLGHGRYVGQAAGESRFDCANLPSC